MQRRAILGGGFLAALTGTLLPARGADAAQRDADSLGSERAVQALQKIADELRQQRTACGETVCGELELVRTNQRTFARGQGKFPDFIDVSFDVWEKVYDWLVRTRQPANAVRLPDGRYAITFCFTQVVLRPELTSQYVSLGYDVR